MRPPFSRTAPGAAAIASAVVSASLVAAALIALGWAAARRPVPSSNQGRFRLDAPELEGATTAGAAPRLRADLSRRLALMAKAVVLVVFLNWLDPFSVGEAIQRTSADIVARTLGVCHPKIFCVFAPEAPAGNRVAVVLYDDAYVQHADLGHSWPPPLRYHERLLNALAASGARAVFFDVLFGWDRENGAAAFAEEITQARDQGTSVVLAHLPPGAGKQRPGAAPEVTAAASLERMPDRDATADNWLLQRLGQAATRTAPVSWTNEHPWQAGVRYPCVAKVGPGGFAPTPAVVMYSLMRGEREQRGAAGPRRPEHCVGGDASDAKDREDQALFLAWGLPPSDAVAARPRVDGCVAASAGLWSRISLLSQAFLVGLERKEVFKQRPCLRIDTYSALEVLADSRVRDSLQGRAVLVGVGYRASNDLVETPFGILVPGVHLHATALDNLLTFGPGGHYPWDDRKWFKEALSIGGTDLPMDDGDVAQLATAVVLPFVFLVVSWGWQAARGKALGARRAGTRPGAGPRSAWARAGAGIARMALVMSKRLAWVACVFVAAAAVLTVAFQPSAAMAAGLTTSIVFVQWLLEKTAEASNAKV